MIPDCPPNPPGDNRIGDPDVPRWCHDDSSAVGCAARADRRWAVILLEPPAPAAATSPSAPYAPPPGAGSGRPVCGDRLHAPARPHRRRLRRTGASSGHPRAIRPCRHGRPRPRRRCGSPALRPAVGDPPRRERSGGRGFRLGGLPCPPGGPPQGRERRRRPQGRRRSRPGSVADGHRRRCTPPGGPVPGLLALRAAGPDRGCGNHRRRHRRGGRGLVADGHPRRPGPQPGCCPAGRGRGVPGRRRHPGVGGRGQHPLQAHLRAHHRRGARGGHRRGPGAPVAADQPGPGRHPRRRDPRGRARRHRRPPARLRPPDPHPHPQARRRARDGGPPGPLPGARAARLALHRPPRTGHLRGRRLHRPGR